MEAVLTVGRYGIDEWLASGAMGVVFRGYDPVLNRPVAIKILRRELAKGSAAEGWRERFRRGARAAGRLFHPNIVTILDFGEDHDMPYLVMEYVDGSGLDRLLKISGPLAPQRAVAMTLQVLSALKYAYENGVVHLDIKSSVVLVLANDQVKVADFGIALMDAAGPTGFDEVPKAATYMAPEQLVGAPVDHRTDLFTAGAVLYEMLTCAKPFPGGSVVEIVAQMETGAPEDVCVLNPEVPSALRSVIDTALAYDPGRRFATASAFSRALAEAVSVGDKAESVMRSPPSVAAMLDTRSPADEAGWDPEILRIVEGDLAQHIGPVAAIAVKRAARKVSNLVALYDTLAAHIESDRERDEFLAKGRRITERMFEGITFSQSENSASDTTVQESRPADPLDPAVLDAIEAELAQYVGPIAKILVKRQLQSFESVSELFRTLAEHIPDEAERAAFLRSGRAG